MSLAPRSCTASASKSCRASHMIAMHAVLHYWYHQVVRVVAYLTTVHQSTILSYLYYSNPTPTTVFINRFDLCVSVQSVR